MTKTRKEKEVSCFQTFVFAGLTLLGSGLSGWMYSGITSPIITAKAFAVNAEIPDKKV
jgi:hypothetical protein